MNLRFACAASALTIGCALAAPAMAQGALTPVDAAATTVAAAAAIPLSDAEAGDEIAGFELSAAAAPAPAATIAAGNGEVIVSSAALAAAAQASGTSAPRDERFSVVMNQDAFFGFYPTFNGLIPVSDNVDLSFYGIMWTTDAFGTGLGSDLWTEFGIGANFLLNDGKLQVKPQIGLTNGSLLSGGVVNNAGNPTRTGGNFADGIVPSLTINYSDETFEAEYYGGYYAALRNRNENAALDFLHTWVNAGYKFSSNFSAGAHYELLSNTRNTFPGGSTNVVYQWLGPYVQFTMSKGFFARFTAGADIEDGGDGDFYKLAVGMSF